MKWNVLCFALLATMTTTAFAQSGAGFPKHMSGVYNIYAAEKRIQTDDYEVSGIEKAVDVLKMLDATTAYRIEGEQLTLLGGDQVLARFEAVYLR